MNELPKNLPFHLLPFFSWVASKRQLQKGARLPPMEEETGRGRDLEMQQQGEAAWRCSSKGRRPGDAAARGGGLEMQQQGDTARKTAARVEGNLGQEHPPPLDLMASSPTFGSQGCSPMGLSVLSLGLLAKSPNPGWGRTTEQIAPLL